MMLYIMMLCVVVTFIHLINLIHRFFSLMQHRLLVNILNKFILSL